MNWTQTTVSMVQNVTCTTPTPVKLGQWVKAMKVSNIDHLHKRQRPALLPHGLFRGGRTERHCVLESGLMQFDIDLKHNPDLCHRTVKAAAAQMPNVVLCAVSAGGGLWGLAIRDGDQDEQLQRLATGLGVTLDVKNSRNVAQFSAQPAMEGGIRILLRHDVGYAGKEDAFGR